MPFFHWNLIKLYFNKSEVVFNLLKAFHLLVFKNFFLFYNKFISSFVYENFILFLKTNTNLIIIHHFYFLSIYIFILCFSIFISILCFKFYGRHFCHFYRILQNFEFSMANPVQHYVIQHTKKNSAQHCYGKLFVTWE